MIGQARVQFLLVVVGVVLLPNAGFSQNPSDSNVPASTAKPQFAQRLQQLEQATNLSDTERAKAVESLKQAISEAESEATLLSQATAYRAKIDSVDSEVRKLNSDLSTSKEKKFLSADAIPLDELDNRVRQKSAELENLRQDLSSKTGEIRAREQRLLQIPRLIADANQRLSEAERGSNVDAAAERDSRVTDALNSLYQQRRTAIRQEIETLKLENAWEIARGELLNLQRDLAKQKVTTAQEELERWERAAREKRETEVDRHIRLAAEYLARAPEPLKDIARENQDLAKRRSDVQAKLQSAAQRFVRVDKLVEKLNLDYQRAQAEAETSEGLSRTLGEVLREKRSELRAISNSRTDGSQRTEEASDVRLQLYLLREAESDLGDLESAASDTIESSDLDIEGFAEVRVLLQFRKSVVEGLRTDTEALFQELAKLEGAERSLHTIASDYATFIDERVLWLRSTSPVTLQTAAELISVCVEIAKSKPWRSLPGNLLKDLGSRPLIPVVLIFVCLPWFMMGIRLRQRLRGEGEKAAVGSCRDFSVTLRASLLTIAVSSVLPASFYLIGLWLQGTQAQQAYSGPMSAFYITAAFVLLPLEFWRQSARSKGMMECHFAVPHRTTEIIRRNLRSLTLTLVPMMAISEAVRAAGNPLHEQTIGRLAFTASMMILAVFIYRVAHPSKGALQIYWVRHANTFLFRIRHFLFAWALGTPLLLMILSVIGYQFTASQLAERLLLTSLVLLGFWFANALALRWVVLSRRRLAMEQTRARLAKVSEATSDSVAAEAHANLEEIDLSSVDLQTRRLVRALTVVAGAIAVWSLWVDVLPALSRFDDMRAWDVEFYATSNSAESSTATASDVAGNAVTVRVVSYTDVAKAIAIFVAMLLAMRDLPGLLELVLLQRLPLDNALRLAISTLTRYVIFLVGMAWALSCIEIGWSKIQWLVAGVSVGLGFGLQEIFANFVSGLIILFERPLRSGDIVTIDGVTGTVKNVRMRATIIQDLDRKDFVVPNKDFITGRLLNWTLSDEVSRIVLRVGVAYGSDTAVAKQLMLNTAQNHHQIVKDPPPQVTFEEFGESSLNLVLRCFITLQSMPSRMMIVDELHSAIDNAFRAASIQIPFPQRDLHFRSSDIQALATPSDGNSENGRNQLSRE